MIQKWWENLKFHLFQVKIFAVIGFVSSTRRIIIWSLLKGKKSFTIQLRFCLEKAFISMSERQSSSLMWLDWQEIPRSTAQNKVLISAQMAGNALDLKKRMNEEDRVRQWSCRFSCYKQIFCLHTACTSWLSSMSMWYLLLGDWKWSKSSKWLCSGKISW